MRGKVGFLCPEIRERERERKFDPLGEITYDIENVERGFIYIYTYNRC